MMVTPLLPLRGIPIFLWHLKKKACLPIKTREVSRCYCCKTKGHHVPLPLEMGPDFSAPLKWNPQGSPYNTKGRLTALLHPAQAHVPHLNWTDGLTPPFTTLQERGDPRQHERCLPPLLKLIGNWRSLSQLESTEFPASARR